MKKEKPIKSNRVPRPFGLTNMMMEYNSTKSPQLLQNIQRFLINYWITNNMTYCGKPYSINKFAQSIGVDVSDIRLTMRDMVLNNRIWDKDNQQALIESMLGEQMAWALEDRMEAAQQVEILRESQGNSYKPFVSAELGKALKLKLDTTNNLSQIIKQFVGNSGINVNVNVDNSQNTTNNITIEEARTLIQQVNEQQALERPSEVKLLETQYDIASLPEVRATKQTGVDTSKEGLSFSKTELNSTTDDYKGAMNAYLEDRHEMRREIEENIAIDEDDPELDIYDEDELEIVEPNSFTAQFLNH